MADSETAVSTPKKKNNRNRKKKNDGQKHIGKNTTEPSSVKGGSLVKDRVDSKTTPNNSNHEGGIFVMTERKNTRWEDSRQSNIQPAKRKENSAKKFNTAKVDINPPTSTSQQPPGEGRRRNYAEERLSKELKNPQIDHHKRHLEGDRRRKWVDYFMSKPNDFLLLDRNKVILLKMVEPNRPQAQFFCKVCNYYCDNMSVVGTHIRKTTHIRQLQDWIDEITITEVPDMTQDQMSHLNEFLKWQVNTYSMDPINLETRRTIGVLVSELVSSNLPGCQTRLFGSSIHGLGLKNSDVNIDLQVPEGSLPPEMLKQVAALLRKSPHFVDVLENFHCEFPFISFKYKKSDEVCSISLNNERAVSLAILLSKYTPLDPRLAQLASLFRLWGQMTGTDKAQDGTWPGYAFYLLTIFYLQNCLDPVLPVLNDFVPKSDDPETTNSSKVLSLDIGEIKQKWTTKNKQTLAQLWLGMLKFYTIHFNYTEFMVCIDSSVLKPRKTRKLFIVDPFLPTRNVARSNSSNATFSYIMGCLMTTCKYYSIPQAKFGPLFKDIYVPAAKYYPELETIVQNHNRVNSYLINLIMKMDPAFNLQRGDIEQSIADARNLMLTNEFHNVDSIPLSFLNNPCPPRHLYGNMSVSPKDARQLVTLFSAKLMDYNLKPEYFTGGEKVPKVCGVCKREGHLKDECPEERLPPLDPLPERKLEDMKVLDKLCHFIFEKWRQNDDDIRKRQKICEELEEFIGDVHPTVKLELFGSTKNGFGLKGSDMDICLTFDDNKTGEGLDTRGFIEVLYRLLKTFRDLQDLLPIATAKVPIVKFTHRPTKLDGDISLYNVLALENSKLLCTYAQIDERARVLGYMMKRFSKVCHIGDASKGSLSSYAYTLLVIYFLQRCDPPVLPVLQELTEDGKPAPIRVVEGCNAYFFSDLSKLDAVWPGKNQNKQSVGELWLDLLIFYTEKFDLLNNVICIRCSRIVTKFEKLWISNGIAIEDPFDLSHNLGSALTRKMYLYIIKALRKGRNHFAKPIRIPNRDCRAIEIYFLNPKELTDGDPPNDRGCRVCKSIGHKERECPQKKKKKSPKGMKNKNKSETETSKKAPFSGEDEDEDPNGFSESDNGSSDVEENAHPRVTPNDVGKQVPSKKNLNVSVNHNRDITSNTRGGGKTSRAAPAKKKEWQSEGFQQPIPPGFIVQDPNRASGPHTFQRVVNPQPTTWNQNLPASPILSKSEMGIVSHKESATCESNKIPMSMVFSNSKLITDPVAPLPNPSPNSVPTVRFPLPFPPPGFVPISQAPQFANPSFPRDKNNQGQQIRWTPVLRQYSTEDLPRFPQFVPAHPTHLIARRNIAPAVGVTPRPTIGPAFANPQVVGMQGPTEQLIWGQEVLPPPAFPSQIPPSPTLSCDSKLAKMHISSQNDLSKNESKIDHTQSKHIQIPFSTTNSSMLNNTT